ncbi:recQ-mediated genome instability protein 1-like isoform X2 [Varroa jacobsoni]|uniref:recQ-mediated genome instability protein 1-like isoform X2 n=1 Tax=Varroa jacobsoni TaxID=62625 RepID=UPI000BF6DE3A|nr:recQ-mediated genome instability protein 1-like isoform X2 [Varroa jacobsoni]
MYIGMCINGYFTDTIVRETNELSSQLRARYCSVPREWLKGFVAQHPLSTGDECYQTLLNTDLSRVGLFSLPNNIFPIKARGVIQNCLLVQVVSVLDVGASAYSQLCHLEGTLNINNEVSADETGNVERETIRRGRRCLLLKLSDGRCTIRAIEFEPVDCLAEDIPRGSKLLLRGPLEIRRSIIFLRAGAVEFLGGSALENSALDGQGSQHQNFDADQLLIRTRELKEALEDQRVKQNGANSLEKEETS